MMLGFSLVVLAETSAEGGETLKVCWSCVDLPRPLETQTIFSISPGSTQLILFFFFCSAFLYFSSGRPVSGETDDDDTESFVAKAYDRCFVVFISTCDQVKAVKCNSSAR